MKSQTAKMSHLDRKGVFKFEELPIRDPTIEELLEMEPPTFISSVQELRESFHQEYLAALQHPDAHSEEMQMYIKHAKEMCELRIFESCDGDATITSLSDPEQKKRLEKDKLDECIDVIQNLPFTCLPVNKDLLGIEEMDIMASIQELKELFLKECLLILYHPNARSEGMKVYIEQLQDICRLKVFEDVMDASNFIEKSDDNFCIIISEVNCQILIERINKTQNVFSVTVLCSDSNSQFLWDPTYTKKINIESTFQALIDRAQKDITRWQKKGSSLRSDFPIFSPIFSDYEKSENNYLNVYLTQLVQFSDREQSKMDFLKLARNIYQDGSYLDDFEKNYKEYNMHNILNWYTKESFLYKLTNNCLRLAKSDTVYYCRFAFKDLETAIKEKYRLGSHKFSGLLYRGAYISTEDWDRLKQNEGKEIEMHGFLSTSKNPDVAESFAQENRDKKALITIIVPSMPDTQGQGFAELAEHSDMPDEDEVLFNIRSRFAILQVHFKEINGVIYRHLVLLYGVQEMRRFMSANNPTIKVDLLKMSLFRCLVCQSDIEPQNSVLFINVQKHDENICYNCVKAAENIGIATLACSGRGISSQNIQIEGIIVKPKNTLKFSDYGYECMRCHNTNIRRIFVCQVCRSKDKWCNECFNENVDCLTERHLIIVENEANSFWSEKIRENDMFKEEIPYLSNPGLVFINTLDFMKAKEYYEKTLSQSKMKWTSRAAGYYSQLGIVYQHLGELKQAKECHLNALEIWKALLGDKHYHTAIAYSNLGSVYWELDEVEKAKEYHSNALRIWKTFYKDEHPNIAHAYSNLGHVHSRLGELEEAMEYHLNALKIRKAINGDHHSLTSLAYSNLGSIHLKLGELEKAKEYYSDALQIMTLIYGDKHPQTADTYSCLGSVYYELGQLEKAKEYHSHAMQLSQAIYGDNHPKTAHSYHNLALLNKYSRELEKAREDNLKALQIRKAFYGEIHSHTAASYNNLGGVYMELRELEEAVNCYTKTLEIMKRLYEDKHPEVLSSCKKLEEAIIAYLFNHKGIMSVD